MFRLLHLLLPLLLSPLVAAQPAAFHCYVEATALRDFERYLIILTDGMGNPLREVYGETAVDEGRIKVATTFATSVYHLTVMGRYSSTLGPGGVGDFLIRGYANVGNGTSITTLAGSDYVPNGLELSPRRPDELHPFIQFRVVGVPEAKYAYCPGLSESLYRTTIRPRRNDIRFNFNAPPTLDQLCLLRAAGDGADRQLIVRHNASDYGADYEYEDLTYHRRSCRIDLPDPEWHWYQITAGNAGGGPGLSVAQGFIDRSATEDTLIVAVPESYPVSEYRVSVTRYREADGTRATLTYTTQELRDTLLDFPDPPVFTTIVEPDMVAVRGDGNCERWTVSRTYDRLGADDLIPSDDDGWRPAGWTVRSATILISGNCNSLRDTYTPPFLSDNALFARSALLQALSGDGWRVDLFQNDNGRLVRHSVLAGNR